MTVGNPDSFAIESRITQAWQGDSRNALGFFNIHVGGVRYGIFDPEATMLRCSLDEVRSRLLRRGKHVATFSAIEKPMSIAEAYANAEYGDVPVEEVLGLARLDFLEQLHGNHLIWAPDGDEAFEDRSHILQFDDPRGVRLVAFKFSGEGPKIASLSDQWLDPTLYYHVLDEWATLFETEWSEVY